MESLKELHQKLFKGNLSEEDTKKLVVCYKNFNLNGQERTKSIINESTLSHIQQQ